jgi:hypothetical protein
MVNKLVGYVLALVGLVGLAVTSVPALSAKIPSQITGIVSAKYLIIGALVLVILGAVLAFGNSRGKWGAKQAAEEVPIYQGEGKNRKIIGYKRA